MGENHTKQVRGEGTPLAETLREGVLLPLRADCRQEACPTCGLYFMDLSAMRKHRAKKHGIFLVNPEVRSSTARAAIDLTPHMVDGMPRCPPCAKVFPRLQGLKEHIMAHCPMLHGSGAQAPTEVGDKATLQSEGAPLGHTCREPLRVPVVRRKAVQQRLQQGCWRGLLHDQDLLKELKSFCVVCALKTHIR